MVEISKPELRARNMAINLFPGLYLMPNQAAIMAGTMATNAHHVASGNVPVGLITGMDALIDTADKVANNACTVHQSIFMGFYSSFFCSAISFAKFVWIC
jgi:hypothetical protein